MDEGLREYVWANRKVALLEDDQARRGAYTEPNYQYNFRAAVSCPPDTRIHMRGGQVWGDPDQWDGRSWYVDSASYDLADATDTGYNYTFTNADYYRPMAVMLRYSGNSLALGTDPPIYIMPGASEYATAAEAEEAAYPPWPGGEFDPDAWWGIPLGIFIIKNNGNTTLPNQFLPIDRVNRGRSYLFRQLRLRFQW